MGCGEHALTPFPAHLSGSLAHFSIPSATQQMCENVVLHHCTIVDAEAITSGAVGTCVAEQDVSEWEAQASGEGEEG